MTHDICHEGDIDAQRPEPELAQAKQGKFKRKSFLAVGLGGLIALVTGKREAKAYWQIGWCCYSRCVGTCLRYYYCAPQYQNEYGQVWCGTYQYDHRRTCDTTCADCAGCGCGITC